MINLKNILFDDFIPIKASASFIYVSYEYSPSTFYTLRIVTVLWKGFLANYLLIP